MRIALGILDRDEDGYYDGPAGIGGRWIGLKPRFWDAYVGRNLKEGMDVGEVKEEREWRWMNMKVRCLLMLSMLTVLP